MSLSVSIDIRACTWLILSELYVLSQWYTSSKMDLQRSSLMRPSNLDGSNDAY